MSEEILINITPRERRVAVVENGVLQEVHLERLAKRGLVGNIFKGCVSRVMPGMDAAFVDIGLEKAAFIHASDVTQLPCSSVSISADSEPVEQESIANLLHDGQQVLVQVVKDQLGTKGARLTTNITIPSRYVVLMPYAKGVRLSARLEDEAERSRLTELMEQILLEQNSPYGCILRTAAESASSDELRRDLLKFIQICQ